LVEHWSVSETEAGSSNFSIFVKRYIGNELLSANTILLAALALYLDLNEILNL